MNSYIYLYIESEELGLDEGMDHIAKQLKDSNIKISEPI